MTERDIGRIEEVNIREVWPNEAVDFTPWLAENLDVLGKELGIELELDRTEAPVGKYSLDILATDVNGDSVIAIENQIAGTDHSHLGQLMTYAAGTRANIVVWIASKFQEEHRAALDWLNEGTGESLEFFGVEVRAVKIGDSQPAPLFRLIATPNLWVRDVKAPTGNLTERQKQYVLYWRPLLEKLRNERGWRIKTENSVPHYNAGSGLGRGFGSFGRTMRFARGGEARVELWIQSDDKDWNKKAFDVLIESREEIEKELGLMIWDRLDSANGSKVGVSRTGSMDSSDEEKAEIRDWMLEHIDKFRHVFRPHLEHVLEELQHEAQP